jgi:hypothetical protein
VFAVDLPSYTGDYTDPEERKEIAALVAGEKPRWREVEKPSEGAVVLCRMGREPVHVGIVVDPIGCDMLHIRVGMDSCVECFDSPKWKPRVIAIYEHPEVRL